MNFVFTIYLLEKYKHFACFLGKLNLMAGATDFLDIGPIYIVSLNELAEEYWTRILFGLVSQMRPFYQNLSSHCWGNFVRVSWIRI